MNPPTPMAKTRWHILLIDDSADDRADLRQMLLRGGNRRYRFSEAALGADGVRQVLDPTQGPIDCVLLDYSLPDMDAPEVLAALRQGAELPPCPVVVITGTEGEDGLSLLSAGAQDYIGKRGTSADSLTRVVENAVERFALVAGHQRAEKALRTSEERYRTLFNSIDAGYAVLEMIFDDQGVAFDARYLQVNTAFSQQTGMGDVEGRTVRSLIPDIERQWFDTYGSVALTGVSVRFERYSEALQIWFDSYAFRLGEPQARQVAVLFYDITVRKRAELALTAATAEAERASRVKSDFLLSMSHELRSPLSTMLGFTQLTEAGTPAPTAAQHDSLQQVLKAGWYLLGLVNEILDLTVVESGKLVLAMQMVSLRSLVQDCRAMVEPQAQAAGVELEFNCVHQPCVGCADQHCLVQADPLRTQQVLLNLLSNAIKYNRRPGRVTVRWAVLAERRVRVSVEDTGPGLSAAQTAQLFQPFNRLGQEATGTPGTGIGLVFSKRLVELMGGSIGVHSTVGVGSCFWFELDAAPALTPRSHPVNTVLHIEDNAQRLQRIVELAERWPSIRLLRARDTRGGIEIARSARPDTILMGVPLHDPCAVKAMHRLANDPATAHIPVIALGHDALPPDIEAGLAAGCFDYLSQTLHDDVIGRALELAFQRGRRATPRETP